MNASSSPLSEDERYAQQWPLHDLARNYGQGSCTDDEAWFSSFRAILDAYGGANTPCNLDTLPFDLLLPAGNSSWQFAPQAAALLVEHGFNPLHRISSGVPAVEVFLGAQEGTAHEAIGIAVVAALARCERTGALRTENGGNFFHALCQERPELLPWVLDHHNPIPGAGRLHLPQAWFNAPNNEQRRPLDLIWDANGKWHQAMMLTDEGEQEIEISFLLAATGSLLDGGADIFTTTPTSFVLADAIYTGVCASENAREQLRGSPLLRMLEHHALDQGTLGAPPRRRGLTRL